VFKSGQLLDFPISPFYSEAKPGLLDVGLFLLQLLLFQIGGNMAKKSAKRREWTSTDVRELKTLARQKTPARKIARTLKRTEGATRQKAFSLGVSLDSRS
jgi:hypothetical protein